MRITSRQILLLTTIDTEEDNWHRAPGKITVDNVRELPGFADRLESLGVRPTFFTAYQVAAEPWAAEILREIAARGRSEIAAHLHPWNTPPVREALTPETSMLANLPYELQAEKVETLTRCLTDAFGRRPTAFRAGRLGLGPGTTEALVRYGYRVDSSVAPYLPLEPTPGMPDFSGAPVTPYRVMPGADVRQPHPTGALAELPLSAGFSRAPFPLWERVFDRLSGPTARRLRIPGVASRTGLIKKLILSPELETVDDMLLLSRRLIEQGVSHLNLLMHSPTLRPGLTPYTQSAEDVRRFVASLEEFIGRLGEIADVAFATVSEAADRLCGASPAVAA